MKPGLYVWWMLCLCAIAGAVPVAAASAEACALESRIPLTLRIGTAREARSVSAYLVGSQVGSRMGPGLRIVEAESDHLLWSAGATGTFMQRFVDMTAGFATSLAAIDTDGDGAHDRLYAGDLQGRLWRFDIGAISPTARWVTGGKVADLSGGASSRGFLAAPDVTLIAPAGAEPWLSIAVGTAYTLPALAGSAMSRVENRFYVLRDRAPFEHWSQRQYDRWLPIIEDDLVLMAGGRIGDAHSTGAGFYVNLGAGQVIASSLTLDGNTLYTVAHTSASRLPICSSTVRPPDTTEISVGSVSTIDGSPGLDLNGDGSRDARDLGALLDGRSAVDTAVTLVRDENSAGGDLVCAVDDYTLPGCSLDTSLHRSFWRRQDAD